MAKKSNKSVPASVEETKVEQVEQVEVQAEETTETVTDSTLAGLVQNLQESVEKAGAEQTQEVQPTQQAPAVKVDKNQGVGQFVRKLIAEGMSNKDILKVVHEAYGNTQTTYACVAWYRNKMKKANQAQKTTTAVSTVQEFLNKEETTSAEGETPAENS